MECVLLGPNSLNLLERYFLHPLSPVNNSGHSHFKTELYDGNKGIMFLLVDNDEIIATYGAIIVQLDNDTVAAKLPHRLHVRRDYSKDYFDFIDKWFEPRIFSWLAERGINNVMMTINEGNERPMYLGGTRHYRRRKYAKSYLCSHGQKLLEHGWYIQPYLILEQNVWQYVFWNSLDDLSWDTKWRKTKDISQAVINELNQRFTLQNQGWFT